MEPDKSCHSKTGRFITGVYICVFLLKIIEYEQSQIGLEFLQIWCFDLFTNASDRKVPIGEIVNFVFIICTYQPCKQFTNKHDTLPVTPITGSDDSFRFVG